MRWLLDTNVWIEAAAGVPHAANALLKAASIDWCGYSAITRLEVFGFPRLTPAEEKHLDRRQGASHVSSQRTTTSGGKTTRAITLRGYRFGAAGGSSSAAPPLVVRYPQDLKRERVRLKLTALDLL